MLRVERVCFARGGRDLLADLDWSVDPGDRIGLVGANGVGKTSLLRILADEIPPDSGRVLLGRGERVGYLPQEGLAHTGRTLREEARAGMVTLAAYRRDMEASLAALEALPADDPRHAQALAAHERAEAAYRAHGGYAADAQVARVLHGLGFSERDLDRDCAEQSGGWQMRIALAKLLLESPEYLLLDEPTNHLDIEARTWLEHFLAEYRGAVVVVSHDRAFLDRVAARVCELGPGGLETYHGTFTAFLSDRAERLDRLRKAHAEQQEEIRRVELFIRRFRAKNTKAAQVQSRIKALEKMERIELPETQERIRFRFPAPPRSGPWPLQLRGGVKRYGKLTVLGGVDLSIGRGDKICLAGPNGAGKSTLLRVLAEREPLDAGQLECDHHLRVAYFAQDQAEELPAKATVLETAAQAAPEAPLAHVRSLLGAFLFRGDAVDKRCEVLSGGERSRLALCRILLQEANLLLLDEPTNHLDLQGKETLQDALLAFEGSVVFVSHDRDFVDALAESVVEVGGGQALRYAMGFEDFLWRRALDLGYRGTQVEGVPGPDLWFLRGTEFFDPDAQDAPAGRTEAEARSSYEERKKLQRRIDALRRRIEEIEEESARSARERAALEREMAESPHDHQRLCALQARCEDMAREESRRAAAWETAAVELEDLERRL
jgi:ATP-binding cassette subfamily F protein 3